MRTTAEDNQLFLYRFDDFLKPADRIPLEDSDDMCNAISRAMKLRETISIVDEEDTLIFRCENGNVCWPRVGEFGVAA